MLSGLPPMNWFTAPPQHVPSALQPPSSLISPTWAQLFLHGSMATRPKPAKSPIIAITTDHSCAQCYFAAYTDNTQLLLDYTRILHKILTDWAGPSYTIKAEIREARATAQLLRTVTQPETSPTTTAPDLQTQLNDLTSLVRQLVTKLDDQSLRLAPPDAASITLTLSSASQSALSQCDTFLSTISSHLNTFLTDHSLQLASLYARSNSTDSRDQQLYNLVRSFAVDLSATGRRNDSFRTAVEQNTEQVARLVEELARLRPSVDTPPASAQDAWDAQLDPPTTHQRRSHQSRSGPQCPHNPNILHPSTTLPRRTALPHLHWMRPSKLLPRPTYVQSVTVGEMIYASVMAALGITTRPA